MPIKPLTHKPITHKAPRHSVVSENDSKVRKDHTNASGYGYKWKLASRAWLKAHPLCVECEQAGRVTLATEVHHTQAHRGDMAVFWNKSLWSAICHKCHSRLTAKGQ